MRTFIIAVSVIFLFPGFVAAQDTTRAYNKYEFILGVGDAESFETGVFNVPNDVKFSPDFAFNLAFRYYFNERFALGMHIYGPYETISDYGIVDDEGNFTKAEFTLGVFNFGMQVKWISSPGRIYPYGLLVLNYTEAMLNNPEIGEVGSVGFSFGGGGGLCFGVSNHVAISLEAIISFGIAHWEKKPFVNSTGTEFNPSMAGITVNVSYLWGKGSEIK